MTKKSIEEIYVKMDQRDHILNKPNVYIGEVQKTTENMWVMKNSEEKMEKKEVCYSPGLVKIFDEILVNSIDHSVKDETVTYIKVDINKDDGSISVINNGSGIPIELHKEHKVYVPELIFGHLLTSSNYSEDQKRVWGGTNGLGAKLTNIYSKKFLIETCDGKKHYSQEFSENMSVRENPKITSSKVKPYTKVVFWTDFLRFGMTELESDTYSVLVKRVYDTVANTPKRVSVFLDGKKLKTKSFLDYIKLFPIDKTSLSVQTIEKEVEGNVFIWEVGYCVHDSEEQISFVNGIATSKGGKHVDHIVSSTTKKIIALIEQKKKSVSIRSNYIKDRMFFFVRATILNPSFSSQSKECLTTPIKDFGIKFEVDDAIIQKLCKTKLTDDLVALSNLKLDKEASKTDGKKKNKISVPKLDDANWAGSAKSSECTLILTEGESAKTFALRGVNVLPLGKYKYGVFPLRGKVLNVREASVQQITANAEVTNLKKILGLQQGKIYKDVNELRYGSIMILTDSDVDGIHISGLIMNVFHYFWPELLRIEGFFKFLKTPVIRLKTKLRNKCEHEFYNLQDYNIFKQTDNLNKYNVQYVKGLGTSEKAEAVDCFKKISTTQVLYINDSDQKTDDSMKLAFEKAKADNRKEWLQRYDYNSYLDGVSGNVVTYHDFIHKSLIHFSIDDIRRSIPSLVDGLKPSQRKIIYGCFKKNLKTAIKVFQLGSYICEISSYHHGDTSMNGTIVGMAQNFTGSNNVNLLTPSGEFGTRRKGGKDHAAFRYINTKLEDITHKLFSQEDNNVLKYLNDDGVSIEPEYYVPILPMILINGAEGIGTGYSTFIPMYNPEDIIDNAKRYLSGTTLKKISPWYKNYKGDITEESGGKWGVWGIFTRKSNVSIEISEIPIGIWTDDYSEHLDKLESDGTFGITKRINNTKDEDINFEVFFESKIKLDEFFQMSKILMYKGLKLYKSLSTNNMHLFDEFGTIRKYSSPEEILTEFCEIRLKYNGLRKANLLQSWSNELNVLKTKYRFVIEIIDDKLVVFKKTKLEIRNKLNETGYDSMSESYDYLINMPIHSFSSDTLLDIDQKIKKIELKTKLLSDKTNTEMFFEDLALIEFKK